MTGRRLFVVIFLLVLVVGSAFVYGTWVSEPRTASLQLSSSAVIDSPSDETQRAYRGPIDDCLHFPYLYSRNGDVASECSLNYVHFYPRIKPLGKGKGKPTIKIASFNLFHLGDNVAPMKNLPYIARLMNQWDLVGAQELMPLASGAARENREIFELLVDNERTKVSFPYEDWEVAEPGYLQLLKELRKLDSAWALIMQAVPEGEGPTGEMTGFYYRSNLIQPRSWGYCPQETSVSERTGLKVMNYACLLQIPDDVRKLMSRSAFAAYFRSGDFDFIGVSAHVRFKPSKSESDIQSQKKAVCEGADEQASCRPSKTFVGRFYEVRAVANQFEGLMKSAKDEDVIFMGDFNLELKPNLNNLWGLTLKSADGFTVYQDQPTTLSVRSQKLVSNYDHFILNGRASQECDLSSIRTYDFTVLSDSSDNPLQEELKGMLTDEKREQLLEERRAQLAKLVRLSGNKSGYFSIRPLNTKETSDKIRAHERAIERMTQNIFGAVLELIGDHLPIEMECRTDGPDDD